MPRMTMAPLRLASSQSLVSSGSSDASVSSPLTPHSSLWQPDDVTTECMSCARPFTVTFRRHHCRRCGHVICTKCSHTVDSIRVCSECDTASQLIDRGVGAAEVDGAIQRATNHSSRVALCKRAALSRAMDDLAYAIERETLGLMVVTDDEAAMDDAADDAARERRIERFNAFGRQSADIYDRLTALRYSRGFIGLCVSANEANTTRVEPWNTRALLLTPIQTQSPPTLILTAFIYPNPATAVKVQPLRVTRIVTADCIRGVTQVKAFANNKEYAAVNIAIRDPIRAVKTPPSKRAKTSSDSSADDLTLIFHEATTRQSLQTLREYLYGTESDDFSDGTALAPPITPQPFSPTAVLHTLNLTHNDTSNGQTRDPDDGADDSATSDEERLVRDEAVYRYDMSNECAQTLHTVMMHCQDVVRLQHVIAYCNLNDMRTAVSWTDGEHADLLQRLWMAALPTASFTTNPVRPKSAEWKRLGFQSDDPTTDFRGMGLLALRCLVYAAETFPLRLAPLVAAVPNREYPLAATSIGVVAMFADLLGITNKTSPFVVDAGRIELAVDGAVASSHLFRFIVRISLYGAGIDTALTATATELRSRLIAPPEDDTHRLSDDHHCFERFFLSAMEMIDSVAVRRNVKYMAFGEVMSDVKKALVAALNKSAFTVDAFTAAVANELGLNETPQQYDTENNADVSESAVDEYEVVDEASAMLPVSTVTTSASSRTDGTIDHNDEDDTSENEIQSPTESP